jgi:hypothetical protein
MNCRGVSRRLSAFIDNDLSPGIRQSVEEHLRVCRPCARRLEELEAIVASARTLPPLELSAGLKERILATIPWSPRPVLLTRGIRVKFALAGSAFAAAAVLVLLLAGPRQSTEMAAPGGIGTHDGQGIAVQADSAGSMDFTDNPRMKIESFPVPEGAESLFMAEDDSLLLADSTSRIDEFVMPVIDKDREKVVNVKF